jgi:hypothetical protein
LLGAVGVEEEEAATFFGVSWGVEDFEFDLANGYLIIVLQNFNPECAEAFGTEVDVAVVLLL